jgi:asparagine synthase (glutamine-hydrolysing)
MPGITGIIAKTPQKGHRRALDIMLGGMLREPFYSSGTSVHDDLGVVLGWTCHQGSFCDCMPVTNEERNIVLVLFGECFVDTSIAGWLRERGHRFPGSDASCLVHWYEERGEDLFRELNGWFSGVLVDLRQRTCILFNDRYGMQRIYYHENKDGFFFSSEAKALLALHPELRRLDERGLAEQLTCGCVLEDRTLFRGVSLLPGASAWTFSPGGRLDRTAYFKPQEWEEQPKLPDDQFYSRLRDTFSAIVPRYTRSTQRIGVSLTGGLDTRMIMAHADAAPGALPCYTFGGMYRDCYDVKVARKVARACGQPHEVIPLNGGFLSDFAAHAERTVLLSDGNLEVSGAPEIYVNRIAREIAPVRLTGNHGSEIMRDVRFLRARPPQQPLFHRDLEPYLHKAVDTYNRTSSGHPLTFSAFKEAPWFHVNRLAVEQSQVTMRSPYLDNDLVELLYRASPEVRASEATTLRLIADGNPRLAAIFTDRGYGGTSNPFVAKAARMYYELSFLSEYAYDYGMPQWVASIDHLFSFLHLERLFLGRHKFYHFRIWYRDQLSSYVKEILLDPRTLARPLVNRASLETVVREHTEGLRNHTTAITRMLTMELVHRLLVDHAPSQNTEHLDADAGPVVTSAGWPDPVQNARVTMTDDASPRDRGAFPERAGDARPGSPADLR